MDSSRQILRWSIPGWQFVVFLFLFKFLGLVFVDFDILGHLNNSNLGSAETAILAAIFVAAGIPIGYVIYQVYFFTYGRVLPFSIVNLDRGKDIWEYIPNKYYKEIEETTGFKLDLIDLYQEVKILGFPLLILNYQKHISKEPTMFRMKFYRMKDKKKVKKKFERALINNWEIIRFYLSHITINLGSQQIAKEFITLSDIYHSLGASRVALILSYVSYVIYMILDHFATGMTISIWYKNLGGTWIGIFVNLGILLFVFGVLTRNRNQTLKSAQKFLKHSFYAYFKKKKWMVVGESN